MSVKVDGTNGLLQAYDYQVLTTGFSYTFASGVQTLVINPAGTLATGTITMPAAPVDGMVITIESTQQVTAVTVQGNTGQTLTGAPVQLIPNQPLSFMYNLANTKWQPFAGGAGRASTLVSGTSQATTSGTSFDFSGIPSWAKRVTVVFNAVSTNGTNNLLIELGSGTLQTTGYAANSTRVYYAGGTGSFTTSSTVGFPIKGAAATTQYSGTFVFTNISGNIWVGVGSHVESQATADPNIEFFTSGGVVTLSGALTTLRVLASSTATPTDTFDNGAINTLYE